jgi:hypothetical protein
MNRQFNSKELHKRNHQHRIEFKLAEFYEFWWVCVLQGLNKKRAKDDPHVGLKSILYAGTKSRNSREHEKACHRRWGLPAIGVGRPTCGPTCQPLPLQVGSPPPLRLYLHPWLKSVWSEGSVHRSGLYKQDPTLGSEHPHPRKKP